MVKLLVPTAGRGKSNWDELAVDLTFVEGP